ncbi:Asp-tRNA(Asn)/Glu-tRNA(Gln) amidotransferase subunit GatB [Candidatus Aerophobetes bacterium]|nr:Asp-tRNA(Asn)/Glu-tRNA(Gln) amidotransferase subunit GatB [Candidatus Aerophobetes bacterium]
MEKYTVYIGLEVHVELSTQSKLFCGCKTKFGAPPNTQTCPVCLGLPGVLPVINKKAVDFAIITALALNSQINKNCRFARKNYYYPDLPKNYQISQYEEPLATGGWVEININGKVKKIGIQRIHLEEDAGKLIHGETEKDKDSSFVDYNRAGIPLIEIVSKPEISSPEEAHEYLVNLRRILRYLGVSDCNMEEGSLRCDANISLGKDEKMGTKTELKNMNSFKEIREGLKAEIKRQAELLAKGEKIVQETRYWDPKKKKTFSMRGKEEAHDYRYFPEPDLPPLLIDDNWIERLKSTLPELPQKRFKRFVRQYGLPEYDAKVLTESREIADYFEECVKFFPKPKVVSNWIMGDFMRLIKQERKEQIKISPAATCELLSEIEKGTLSINMAKQVMEEMFKTGKGAFQIIEEKGLRQISDEKSLEEVAKEVIKENPKAVNDWKKGKSQAMKFLVGQMMRKTKGKANPQLANKLIEKKLREISEETL